MALAGDLTHGPVVRHRHTSSDVRSTDGDVRSCYHPEVGLAPAHPLLAGLVDDAALFPPGNAPMPAALSGHSAWRAGAFGPMVGRFLCPATKLRDLSRHLAVDTRLRLGLIADTGLAGLPDALAEVAADDRLELEVVEIALPRDGAQADTARSTLDALGPHRGYVELPREAGWQGALAVIAEAGQGAKLRTGGLTAGAFPSEAEVAAFIGACVASGVTFKCTAGLHHAVRHRDPQTGFEHHGFLNILVAAAAAVTGADAKSSMAILSERDGAVLVGRVVAIDPGVATQARRAFAGYGSCSLAEPIDDLTTLGLLEMAPA
jgi:hypothetical protein